MSTFKFKQFEVNQTGCAMKVNTDGVLLGATAWHSAPKRILDIGTGTGVIALMLAQRFAEAIIEAVEIDAAASLTAGENFSKSKFNDRLLCQNIPIQEYNSADRFDLIVSNPPFFVNDMKSGEVRKGIARHADEDFFRMLVFQTEKLLAEDGKLWLVLPVKRADEVVEAAKRVELNLVERIQIRSDRDKLPFRQMICLSRTQGNFRESYFDIYESMKQHTHQYKLLLRDFFLAF